MRPEIWIWATAPDTHLYFLSVIPPSKLLQSLFAVEQLTTCNSNVNKFLTSLVKSTTGKHSDGFRDTSAYKIR
jgi:hypothetical protein